MEKVIENLHVRNVDKELWAKFRGAAGLKRGKLHGILGEELNEALKLYLEKESEEEPREAILSHARTHTHVKEEKKKYSREREEHPSYYGSNYDGILPSPSFPPFLNGDLSFDDLEERIYQGVLEGEEAKSPISNEEEVHRGVKFDTVRGLPIISNTNTKAKVKSERVSPTMQRVGAVVNKLKDNDLWLSCNNFPTPVAQKFIREMVGGDPRSLKKYTALIEHEWVLSEE
ncbi:MAG: hypothetical protein MOIL_01389 [Candidatus Methanolliviera sp. GoM_oil]|nr:MAG: hypothetical protein MOIL_01389 [Candidatus Methanolliviera sp. GoM_oil]